MKEWSICTHASRHCMGGGRTGVSGSEVLFAVLGEVQIVSSALPSVLRTCHLGRTVLEGENQSYLYASVKKARDLYLGVLNW